MLSWSLEAFLVLIAWVLVSVVRFIVWLASLVSLDLMLLLSIFFLLSCVLFLSSGCPYSSWINWRIISGLLFCWEMARVLAPFDSIYFQAWGLITIAGHGFLLTGGYLLWHAMRYLSPFFFLLLASGYTGLLVWISDTVLICLIFWMVSVLDWGGSWPVARELWRLLSGLSYSWYLDWFLLIIDTIYFKVGLTFSAYVTTVDISSWDDRFIFKLILNLYIPCIMLYYSLGDFGLLVWISVFSPFFLLSFSGIHVSFPFKLHDPVTLKAEVLLKMASCRWCCYYLLLFLEFFRPLLSFLCVCGLRGPSCTLVLLKVFLGLIVACVH